MSYKKKCQISKAGGVWGAACSAPTAHTPGQHKPWMCRRGFLPTGNPSLHTSLLLAPREPLLVTPYRMDHPTAGLLGWAACLPAQLAVAACCRRRAAQPVAAAALHNIEELRFLKLPVVVKLQPPSDQAGLLLLQQPAACWGCAEGCACCVQTMLSYADSYVVCNGKPAEPDFCASSTAVAFSDHVG
jgi:hypothetical protein